MNAPAFYAGVDGGGTKTEIVIVDSAGVERARHRLATSNQSVVGSDQAIATLRQCVQEAAKTAGACLPLEHAWFGLAGFDRPEDQSRMAPALTDLVRTVTMSNDGELVLTALPESIGVAIIAGTGSIAVGRDASGVSARAGGWGHIFGDEGSGYDLGRRALEAVARMHDGRGPSTSLMASVLEHWRLDSAPRLIARVYGDRASKGDIAALSDIVVQSAADGDSIANTLLTDAAEALAVTGLAVARRLSFGDDVPLALAGGLLASVPSLQETVIRHFTVSHPVSTVVVVTDPALSAARAAVTRRGVVTNG
ncbi:MAG: hypothetical protein H0W06_03475 [Chloroflexia bacterium]|nr:hypothetical protein [Chloroflexia bacterium]